MLLPLALLATGALAYRSMTSTEAPSDPAALRESCTVSIVLVQSDRSTVARAIDRKSGGGGWTHAALDGCELDELGQHVGIDCRPSYGVTRRPFVEIVQGRPFARVYVPLPWSTELYGCVRGRIGTGYDLLGIGLPSGGRRAGLVCSQLIFECLPTELRRRVRVPKTRPVAPNDLARAWGVRGPGEYEVRP